MGYIVYIAYIYYTHNHTGNLWCSYLMASGVPVNVHGLCGKPFASDNKTKQLYCTSIQSKKQWQP